MPGKADVLTAEIGLKHVPPHQIRAFTAPEPHVSDERADQAPDKELLAERGGPVPPAVQYRHGTGRGVVWELDELSTVWTEAGR